MGRETIDRLIVNSPYEEPRQHWKYDPATKLFDLLDGRREAGYIISSGNANAVDDPGIFVPLPLVNNIRSRVAAWRAAGYPGVTSITRRLLEHWVERHTSDEKRFFFCQIEAIETIIWLTEGPASAKVGIAIPNDGGPFARLCCKMATGSGKTVVMAMLIAWQVLNKVAYPQDTRFSKNVLVLAPGLTVKSRLAVLLPNSAGNYYDEFQVVPTGLRDSLSQGKVLVRNWQALAWESAEQIAKKRGVDKRGVISDEAYTRHVLGEMARAHNLLVINDEAHHAWRVNVEAKDKYMRMRDMKDSAEQATVWVGGLDRLNKARGILRCYDFSATPFTPSGGQSSEEALFGWIVSDFGLNDAIESGLVKTPRVVVRDDAVPDAATYKSRLYHIYNDPEVKDDLNRKAMPTEPLPDLVRVAYLLLGADWLDTAHKWQADGAGTPPVMITVCNRTETAARVKNAFDTDSILIQELRDPARILHIDSRVLEQAEALEEPIDGSPDEDTEEEDTPKASRPLTKVQQAELLRKQVDTVGQPGQPGQDIQNVISVGMLSEGWDAKTVTHVMGLRAFTSQLLCEQVVGRGLRRSSYDVDKNTGRYTPEYVNIFGVPFTFLPQEGAPEGKCQPTVAKVTVAPDPDKAAYEIKWPNVLRIDHVLTPTLKLDITNLEPITLDASQTPQIAELAPVVDGKPDTELITSINLEQLARQYRTQRIIFETARSVYDQMKSDWQGNQGLLLAQIVRIVERFILTDKIRIIPSLFYQDDLRRRLVLTLNMSRIVNHIWRAIRCENTERLEPIFDTTRPIGGTGDMRPWQTSRPCARTEHSHINFCVYDSTWESTDAYTLDKSELVSAWARNDHLGFEIPYIYNGVPHKYWPDFIVKLVAGEYLILETKGDEDEQDFAKYPYLDEWCQAVTAYGGYGTWHYAVARYPGEIKDILLRFGKN